MRIHHMLLRRGVITVFAFLSASCNTVLGVEDVSLGCYINSYYKNVVQDVSAKLRSVTRSDMAMGPELDLHLDVNARLYVALYDNHGQHGILSPVDAPILLSADDAGNSCGICVSIWFSGPVEQYFWARSGELNLTTVDRTRLIGSMRDLELRQVTFDRNDGSPMEIKEACSVAIENLEFNVPYSTPISP